MKDGTRGQRTPYSQRTGRSVSASKKNRLINLKDSRILLFSGMAVLAVSAMITWLSLSDQAPGGIQSSDIDLPEPHQTSATGSMGAEKLEARMNGLIKRVGDLNDRITTSDQETTVIDPATSIEPAEWQAMAEAAQIIETLPSPASGQTGNESSVAKTLRPASDGIPTEHQDTTVIGAAASIESHTPGKPSRVVFEPSVSPSPGTATVEAGQSGTRKPLDTATNKASVMEPHDPATQKYPAVSRDKNNPWVINLVSTTSKAEADRFAEKARSRDIQTEQQQITVKGTQYWRVQITGFSTEEDARAHADTARGKLGLKDVWILKH